MRTAWYNADMVETSFESTRSFTQEEFARWMVDHEGDFARYELLNGRIVMTPPSGWPQGEASATVVAPLHAFVRKAGLGRVFGADQGFELPLGDTVGPDAAFVPRSRWDASAPHVAGKFLRVVPDLIVEILSPSTLSRDRGEKKAIYERGGVLEYWLLDVPARHLTRHVAENGRYGAPIVLDEDQTVTSSVLPGFTLAVRDLLPEP